MMRKKRGFTLIELIVVITILVALLLILIPTFNGFLADARLIVAKSNAKTVNIAFQAVNASTVGKGDAIGDFEWLGVTSSSIQRPAVIIEMDKLLGDLKDKYMIRYQVGKRLEIGVKIGDEIYAFDLLDGTPVLLEETSKGS